MRSTIWRSVLILLSLGANSYLSAQPACPHFTGTLPKFPASTPQYIAGNEADYFSYYNSTWGTETSNATLADYSGSFTMPGASGGTFTTGQGAWSTVTYPNVALYPVNVGDFAQVGCVPGISCGICGNAGADCVNWNIPRGPAIGLRSAYFPSSNGFDAVTDLTEGAVSGGGSLVNVIFLSTSGYYITGNEYGVFYNMIDHITTFYYGWNSNCLDELNNVVCSTVRGDPASVIPKANIGTGNCALDIGNPGTAHYQVYVWNNAGIYQFLVRVTHSNGADIGSSPWIVTPPSSFAFVYANMDGYATFGVNRYDPTCVNSTNCQSYTATPYMTLTSLATFK